MVFHSPPLTNSKFNYNDELKLAMVDVFIPWKRENAADQRSFGEEEWLEEVLKKYHQATI